MTCKTCEDGSYPHYGLAPPKEYTDVKGVPGVYPPWFEEDKQNPGSGLWLCPDCYAALTRKEKV